MTAHSPQAVAAYPATGNRADGSKFVGKNDAAKRTAFDRGRAEKLAEERQRAVTIAATLWPSDTRDFDRFAQAVYDGDPLPVVVSDSTKPSAITYSEAEFSKMMAERDEWYERLDKLIYSLATVEQIGEWSSANDPVAEFEQLIHDERASRPLSDSTKPSEHMKIIRKKALAEASFVVYAYFEKIMQRETAGTDPWYVAQNASVELQGLIDGLFTDDLALLSDSTALIEAARAMELRFKGFTGLWNYELGKLFGDLADALAALHPTSEGDN